jgi:DNA-binding transcriptional LysR family regulator
MNYTLHQLQVFLKVVEKKSVTKASQDLNLSQPAVSIQLRKLQDQFDIPLTEIIGRRLFITDFGYEIAAISREILKHVEGIETTMLAHQGFLAGQLKIALVSTAKYVMPYFLADFMSQHKGVDLKMDVTNKAAVIKDLEQNLVDFALVSVLPEGLELNSISLMPNNLFLVGKPNKNETADPPLLESSRLIFREKGSATRNAMEGFFEALKITGRKSMELTSNEAVKQAVLSGLGYSVVPLIGLKNELMNGHLEILPMKGLPIRTTWNIIWLKNKKLSPVARAYLQYIEAEKDALIKKHFQWYQDFINN